MVKRSYTCKCGFEGQVDTPHNCREKGRVRPQQSKLGSLYESVINIVIGAGVALVSQLLVFPKYGIEVSLNTNLGNALTVSAGTTVKKRSVLRK